MTTAPLATYPPTAHILTTLAGLSLAGYGAWGGVAAAYFLLPGSGGALWAGAALAGLLVLALGRRIAAWPDLPLGTGATSRTLSPLAIAIVAAVAFRLILAAAYPAPQWSDARTYLEIARYLLATGTYRLVGDFPWSDTRAYWPPGTVFWLLPWMAVGGSGRWVIVASNLALVAGATALLWRLVARRWGTRCGIVAVALFALWPNHAFHALFVSKEYIAQFLLLAAAWLVFGEDDQVGEPRGGRRFAAGGACLGAAMLTQPSTIMIPAVLALALMLGGTSLRHLVPRMAATVIGVALVVGPWTLRNYLVLDEVVLINTANGISLLEAAQPGAGGDWAGVPKGMLDESLGEVERSKVARTLALAWIRENPATWLKDAAMRQLWFLGQSHRGAFLAMANELKLAGWHYPVWKFLSDAFMLVVWLGVSVTGWTLLRARRAASPFLLFCVGTLAYFLLMHSVFGSGGRHQPIPGAFALMLAAAGFVRSRALRRDG